MVKCACGDPNCNIEFCGATFMGMFACALPKGVHPLDDEGRRSHVSYSGSGDGAAAYFPQTDEEIAALTLT